MDAYAQAVRTSMNSGRASPCRAAGRSVLGWLIVNMRQPCHSAVTCRKTHQKRTNERHGFTEKRSFQRSNSQERGENGCGVHQKRISCRPNSQSRARAEFTFFSYASPSSLLPPPFPRRLALPAMPHFTPVLPPRGAAAIRTTPFRPSGLS